MTTLAGKRCAGGLAAVAAAGLLLLIGWAMPLARAAAPSAATVNGRINVRDFGATGDGVTDDTDALQRALLAAGGDARTRFLYWAWTPAPEVFFPPGVYRVTRTLLVPVCGGAERGASNHIHLRGDKAEIRQSDPTRDILYLQKAHRNRIEGLTFVGGRRQIKIWSKNTDSARVDIEDCRFRDAAGPAIDDQLRLDPAVKPANWFHNVIEPYRIENRSDGLPELIPLDEAAYPMCLFVSTGMRISRCTFERCMQVLSVWADWAVMDHCTIETHPEMDGPAIRSGAALILDNVTGLGHATPGRRQWWITVDPAKQLSGVVGLDMKRVRLTTDGASGWCVVRNEARFTGGTPVYILAEACAFQSAGSAEGCVIQLVEAPNLIGVRDCRETSGRAVPVVGVPAPFPVDYFHRHSTELFAYVVSGNVPGLMADLPAAMRPFAEPPLPAAVARRFDEAEPVLEPDAMRADIASQVNVADFGARPDGRSDAAEAFARAFAAAAGRRGMTEVVVPAGAYRLDRPVVLPPRIAIRGVGLAAVTVPAGRQGAMFTANQPDHLVVRNLLFFGGDRAIDLVTEPSRESRILIDGCRFDKLDGTAITCKRGTGGMAGISNRTALLIDDCTFVNCRAVLDSDARQARMDHPWITTHRDAAGSGVIVNRGNFHLRWLLGVPRDVNQHWVDNDGRVLLDRCRCGGENGGLPMVRNLTAAGDVLLQNSWLCVSGSKAGTGKRITIVDCDEIPACIALRGNWSRPWPQMMVTIGPRATGSLEGRFFASGNASPLQVRDERRKPPGQERAETDIPGGALATVNVSVSEEQVDGLSKTMLLDFGREVFMEMLLVPPGEMLAGSPADEAGRRDDENRRPVCIATPFYLARTEVTQAVWERVMTADLSRYAAQTNADGLFWAHASALDITGNPRPSSMVVDPRCPVENVSWRQAKEFLARLNLLVPGGGFRLPTEAEWEYAARAGIQTPFSSGRDADSLERHAWIARNSGGKPHPVGTRRPNPWGFHDLHGNVWEWCEDVYTGARYPDAGGTPVTNPCVTGAPFGNRYQAVRGGSFAFDADMARSANRSGFDAWQWHSDIGFRVVRDASSNPVGTGKQ